jgi:hypothetical protein
VFAYVRVTGIHLNVVAPSLLLLALMVLLLTYITLRTCRRGSNMWRCVPTHSVILVIHMT